MGNGTSILNGDASLPLLGILSIANVSTAIMIIGWAWHPFRALFSRLRDEQKESCVLFTMPYLGLCFLSMAVSASFVLGWGNLTWEIYEVALYVMTGWCFFEWIRRGRKRGNAVSFDEGYWRSVLYLGACTFLCISIFLEMLALGAVSGTALGLSLGPVQDENFMGGKLILFNGIGLYAMGVLFFGVGRLFDGVNVINDLRGGGTRKVDVGSGPDTDDDRVRKVAGVDEEDDDVATGDHAGGGDGTQGGEPVKPDVKCQKHG
jgi:hypothetical protein